MTTERDHPYLPELAKQLERGQIDRRGFLRTATLLGMGATAAYAAAGLPAPAQAQTSPAQGGRLRIGMRVHDIKDPQIITWVEASNLIRPVCEFLTRTDHDNITRPLLLEKWEASPDLKTWTLHVHPKAKWRSGRQFTAEDAVWNIKRVLDPKTGSSVLGMMKSYIMEEEPTGVVKDGKPVMLSRLWDANAIELVSPETLRLNLKVAQLAVPEHLFHYPFFMLDPEENGAFKPGMNGTGPFELLSYAAGSRAVMRGRKDYWRGAPHLDGLEFVDLGNDSGALVAALASKQVDGLYEVDVALLDAVKALPHVELYRATTAQTGVARMKVDAKPFDDKRVRYALKLAVDPQKVVDVVFRGNAVPGEDHHVAPIYPDYAKLPTVEPDPARAKKILAEAGYPDGMDLEIACKNQPPWESAVVTVMAEMWKAIGVRVKVNVVPANAYWSIWMKVPFGYTTWAHRPLSVMNLGLAYRTGGAFNESGFSNKEFDRLLTEAESILDPEKRKPIMEQIERIMQEEGPIIQPLWRNVQTGYDKRVKGFKMHPTQYIFAEQLSVES